MTIYLEAIAEIEAFVHDADYKQFSQDRKTQLAVVKELEIIGEASKRLSEEYKKNLRPLYGKKLRV